MELDVTRRALHRFVNPFRSDCFRGQFAPHSCMALRAQFPEPVDVPADNLCIGLPECIQQECVFPVYGFFVPAVSLIVSYQLRRRDEARSRSFELREIRRMPELESVEIFMQHHRPPYGYLFRAGNAAGRNLGRTAQQVCRTVVVCRTGIGRV